MKIFFLVATFACLGFVVDHSRAAADLVVTFQEVGSDVVSSASGSIDLSGLTNVGDAFESVSVRPNNAWFTLGGFAGIAHEHLFVPASAGRSGPLSFGDGNGTLASFSNGDFIGFAANGGNFNLYLPENYVTDSLVSGTATYTNHDFASLGIDPGTYTWTAGNNTITLTASSAVVPEPGSSVMLVVTGIALTLGRRRKKEGSGRFQIQL